MIFVAKFIDSSTTFVFKIYSSLWICSAFLIDFYTKLVLCFFFYFFSYFLSWIYFSTWAIASSILGAKCLTSPALWPASLILGSIYWSMLIWLSTESIPGDSWAGVATGSCSPRSTSPRPIIFKASFWPCKRSFEVFDKLLWISLFKFLSYSKFSLFCVGLFSIASEVN